MRKLLMAVLAAAIFSLGTVAVAAVTAPPPASLAYSNTLPDPADLTRLIGVFEARVSESPNHVDLQALGGHYLTGLP